MPNKEMKSPIEEKAPLVVHIHAWMGLQKRRGSKENLIVGLQSSRAAKAEQNSTEMSNSIFPCIVSFFDLEISFHTFQRN